MKMKNETPLLTVSSRPSLRKHAFYGILALVSLLGLGITQSARASFMVTVNQVGTDVVWTGSGAINWTGLTFVGSGSAGGGDIEPNVAGLQMGASGNIDQYDGITGLTSFGSGAFSSTNNSSGDFFGFLGNRVIDVPHNYVSGAPLSDSMTFSNATFASLGLAPGTYEWTWGTGMNADSFTLQIGPAGVPDTGSTLPLLSFALLGLAALRRKLRC
jgi:hypothetical protein